jgi:translation initiation factor IF-1
MERLNLIHLAGVVTGCLRSSLIQVRLPNGHEVSARLDGLMAQKFSASPSDCLLGASVLLELRAFDLSSGRVVEVKSFQHSQL